MPADLVQQIEKAARAGVASPAMRKRLQNEGLVPVGSSAQEFSQFVRKEIDRWAKVVAVTHTKIA